MHPGISLCAAALLAGCAAAPRQAPMTLHYENERIEKAVGYAQAVRAGEWLFVSGTIGRGVTLDEQMKAAYARIEKTLAQHGARFEHVVRETVYTTDFEALKKSEQTRKGFYGTHTPAATWVEIKRLYVPHALLEIEVTARIPAS
jgi:2-iminobutanoate/2-iminopropanoate deaminase